MSIKSIVAVVLRLYAVFALFESIHALLLSIGASAMFATGGPLGLSEFFGYLFPYLIPLGHLIFGILSWVFAEAIAEKVVGRLDGKVNLRQIGAEELSTIGLLVLGCFLFFTHLGATLGFVAGWVFELQAKGSVMSSRLVSEIVICGCGLYLIFFAGRFGKRLSKLS